MTRQDYIKNTRLESRTCDDVLGYFYENIAYTPFIRVEDDEGFKQTMKHYKAKKILTKAPAVVDPLKKVTTSKEPVDPYTIILEGKLDVLRPPVKDYMTLEDPYNYLGTAKVLDIKNIMRTSRLAVLQIESSRSRPEAFMEQRTIDNPDLAKLGVIELPVDKVGVLWRKDPKKKTARSPWQEWGAILTGSGISFFKNVGWVKSLMHQYNTEVRLGHIPVMFKPAIAAFKADHFLPTEHAVALQDATYKRHKNAFMFCSHHGTEETFLADNEWEMNDWLHRLNHQAAFRTAGIRPRGLIGGSYEGQRRRALRSYSANSTTTIQTATGEVTIQSGKIDQQLAQQISAARMRDMQEKIEEAETNLATTIRDLDEQLRDARHLLILAPIQQKTRESIVLAAGKISAKLKWVRIELWRMKCHRDILALDLNDEKQSVTDRKIRIAEYMGKKQSPRGSPRLDPASQISTPSGLARLNSTASNVSSSQRAPNPSEENPVTERPETNSSTDTDENLYQTPPATPQQNRPQTKPLLSPLRIQTQHDSGSSLSPRSPRADFSNHRASISSVPSEYTTPMLVNDNEAEEIRERLDGLSYDGRPVTPSESGTEEPERTPPFGTGSPGSHSRMRRSLHRTLREGRETPSSHRHTNSKRSKDSTSSAVLSEEKRTDGEEEAGLERAKGSFTVHGKKASVITFGSEWQSMSTEERFKLRKQGHSHEGGMTVPNAIEDDESTGAGASPSNHRHQYSTSTAPSVTSDSTTTAPSVRQQRSASILSESDSPRKPLPSDAGNLRERRRAASKTGSIPTVSDPGLASSPGPSSPIPIPRRTSSVDWSTHMNKLRDADGLKEEAAEEAEGEPEVEPKSLRTDKGKARLINGYKHETDESKKETNDDVNGDLTEPVDPDINRVLAPHQQAVQA